MLCDGSNLIDHGYSRSALAIDGNRDWGMWLGGCGKGHNDNGFTQTVQNVICKDNAGSSLFDLRALAGVECNPPNIASFHGASSAISSWNACQSSISRSNSLS
jgi:hypothetical protein